MNRNVTLLLIVLLATVNGFCRDEWAEGIRELETKDYGPTDTKKIPEYVDKFTTIGLPIGENQIVYHDGNNFKGDLFCRDIADESGTTFRPGVFTPHILTENFWIANDDSPFYEINHFDEWHYMVRYVLTYTVTCGNNVTYRGIVEWKIDGHQCEVNCSKPKKYSDWNIPLDDYDPVNYTFTAHRGEINEIHRNVLPVQQLFTAWNGRNVPIPAYVNEPNKPVLSKLPVPVIMIPGFRSDYADTWGVNIPNKIKSSPEFRAGMVTSYVGGSFPDVMARYHGLDVSPEGINSNGIFFFNAPLIDAEDHQADPDWKEDAATSISYAFFKKLEQSLTDHYGDRWKSDETMVIDLIGHSQGGLIAREMLRGVKTCSNCGEGVANPANHVRKLVTVNTPHLGTPLTDKLEDIKTMPEYSSLVRLVEDLDDQDKLDKKYRNEKEREEFLKSCKYVYMPYNSPYAKEKCEKIWEESGVANEDKILVSGDVLAENSRIMDETYNAMWGEWDDPKWYTYAAAITGVYEAMIPITAAVVGIGFSTDISMKIKGNILGDYQIDTKTENITTDHEYSYIGALRGAREYALDGRARGKHLGSRSTFIDRLNKEGYPTLPDGRYLELQPLYSYDMSGLKGYLLGQIQAEATDICRGDETEKDYCIDATQMLTDYVKYQEKASLTHIEHLDETVDYINLLMNQWLYKSDLLVPVTSQTYGYDVDDNRNLVGDTWSDIPQFHKPRTYNIYYSMTPDVAPMNLVIHGDANTETIAEIDAKPIQTTIALAHLPAASLMGMDILCALDNELCPDGVDASYFLKVPEMVFAGVVKAPDGTEMNVAVQELAVTGDFDISPMYQSNGFQGIGISENGETTVVAAFDTDQGAYVWYKDAAGVEHIETLADNSARWHMSMERNGDVVKVVASNGLEEIEYVVPVTVSSSSVDMQFYGDAGSSSVVKVVGGKGVAADASTQERPEVATSRADHPTGDIAVMHYEAGLNEKNTSRPRIVVVNTGDKPVKGFKIAYYFTADPARVPMAEIDYPNYPIAVEHLGDDQWRFVLDLSNETLLPGAVSPDYTGYQVRLHYRDWSTWNHRYDYSSQRNLGYPKVNDQIVVFDTKGNILWGVPPTLPRTSTTVEKKSVEVTFKDAGEHELNMLKPEFTIKNTGNTALQNFTIRFFVRAPEGKAFSTPVEDYYTPEATPVLSKVASNVWMLEMKFDAHILYADQQVTSGNIGIHLADWGIFDKEMLGLVVADENGEILWGTPWDGSGVAQSYMISMAN